MPPRAIWKGAISFGMVAIPIRLFPATQSKSISFVQLHKTCNNRIRQRRYCEFHEQFVETSEIGRAFEYAKEQYVILEDADFQNLPVPSTHTIEIKQFVDLDEIDPVYFNTAYYIEPEGVGAKPYALLRAALDDSKKVAIGKVALRQKEQLCCLRTLDEGLVLETIFYPDEIRDQGDLELPDESVSKLTKQEMELAKTLVDQLSGKFDVTSYQDEYRNLLERVIEAKLTSSEPAIPTAAEPVGQIGDLQAALMASIEATMKDAQSQEDVQADEVKVPKRAKSSGSKAKAKGKAKA